MKYYAHSARANDGSVPDYDESHWQLLKEHLCNVAFLAGTFAGAFGMKSEAEVCGLLHDLGKYARRFQQRLHNNSIHGINHWAAGAVYAGSMKQPLIAFAIDGHHTGMPPLNGDGGLKQTARRNDTPNEWAEWTGCAESTMDLVNRAAADGIIFPNLPSRPVQDRFVAAFGSRMLFSCLVDADFLDTEAHFDPESRHQRRVPPLDAERALALLKKHLAGLPGDGPVNMRRKQLLADCITAADYPPGLFTITAPTGSGKTLSSLAFALQHITKYNSTLPANDPRCLRRIIVVIPFTSIIEQTAQVYRKLFENAFGPTYVLEHHSAVAPREYLQNEQLDAEEECIRRARLAAENWESPLVVTTSVQFFESLFSHRPSDCRKLHNIARSVVIFDEVQTLPAKLVPSLLSAVSLLTENYGVTAVFMTATQPAFVAADKALPFGWKPVEISSEPEAMAKALRRTRIELPGKGQTCTWDEIASRMLNDPQVLCVVNTTKDARRLFELLRSESNEGCYHLSSRLCPTHRRAKLAIIRDRLRKGQPCRLVSTQIIEAGVDVDFPIAFRALGPLDSIIQTAGRCNREGRYSAPRPVIVFRPADGGVPRGAYATALAKTEEFLARFTDASARLHLPGFYAAYFAELYSLLGPQSCEADPVFNASKAFDFPKAAEECRLVGDETHAVLVKWQRGAQLAEKLNSAKYLTSVECREAQRYSVNLYQAAFVDAQAKGYIYQPAKGWNYWVWNSDYDDDLGLGHVDSTSFTL